MLVCIIVIITHSIRHIQTCYRFYKTDPSIVSEDFSGLFFLLVDIVSSVTVRPVKVFFQISSAFSKVLFVEFVVPILCIHKTLHITLIFLLKTMLQRTESVFVRSFALRLSVL